MNSASGRILTSWLLLLAHSVVALHYPEARQPATANVVDAGVIAGAPYYIEIPTKWNKGLVLHAHGYTPEGSKPPQHDSPEHKVIREVFLSCGFAFAASSYRTGSVEKAVELPAEWAPRGGELGR